jgi:hypothetical protein
LALATAAQGMMFEGYTGLGAINCTRLVRPSPAINCGRYSSREAGVQRSAWHI